MVIGFVFFFFSLLRFFQRVYRLFVDEVEGEKDLLSKRIREDVEPTKEQLADLHKTIKNVTIQTEEMKFNTALASMMEFSNAAGKWKGPIAR